MELKDFSYFLPDELIAQHPRQKRDHSRLLFLNKNKEKLDDLSFFQLPELLQSGDVLVINDSRVIPARLFGKKLTGGVLEILLLTRKASEKDSQTWEVLARPSKRLHESDVIDLGNNCEARVLARISDKKWLMKFWKSSKKNYVSLMMPLKKVIITKSKRNWAIYYLPLSI